MDSEGGQTQEKGQVYYVNTTKCNRRCCFIILIILVLLGVAVAIYLLATHVNLGDNSTKAPANADDIADEDIVTTEASITEIITKLMAQKDTDKALTTPAV